VMGTVGYMSPEQATGRRVEFTSDQFSLGTILYELATGRQAFKRPSSAETLVAIIREEPEPMGQNGRVAPPLRWLVERCLSKDPAERYASTKDLARDATLCAMGSTPSDVVHGGNAQQTSDSSEIIW